MQLAHCHSTNPCQNCRPGPGLADAISAQRACAQRTSVLENEMKWKWALCHGYRFQALVTPKSVWMDSRSYHWSSCLCPNSRALAEEETPQWPAGTRCQDARDHIRPKWLAKYPHRGTGPVQGRS